MRTLSIASVLVLASFSAHAQPAASHNLAGSYRCEPEPSPCDRGLTFTITQSGNTLQLKSDKGEQVNANLTSPTTISAGPTWNMLGVVYDNTIEWSNGTRWRKQS
jgi:hypothetical protein